MNEPSRFQANWLPFVKQGFTPPPAVNSKLTFVKIKSDIGMTSFLT